MVIPYTFTIMTMTMATATNMRNTATKAVKAPRLRLPPCLCVSLPNHRFYIQTPISALESREI